MELGSFTIKRQGLRLIITRTLLGKHGKNIYCVPHTFRIWPRP
jgi:hypothetical protein